MNDKEYLAEARAKNDVLILKAEVARLRKALAVWAALNGTPLQAKLLTGELTPEAFLDQAEAGYTTHIERCKAGIEDAKDDLMSSKAEDMMKRGFPAERMQRLEEAMKQSEAMLAKVKEARKLL